jgi:hypothetical protein
MDINHPGPFLAHLSKVPDGQDVRTYDGSGEWIKIYTLGLDYRDDSRIHWLGWNDQQLPGRVITGLPLWDHHANQSVVPVEGSHPDAKGAVLAAY